MFYTEDQVLHQLAQKMNLTNNKAILMNSKQKQYPKQEVFGKNTIDFSSSGNLFACTKLKIC